MSERILVVEDETGVAQAVAYALGQEGFEVTVAADGVAALPAYEHTHPNLVLLDLMLPGVNGWDLFRAFREQYAEMPIIMVTARREETDRVAGLEMGADDYVIKPFSMRELMARVRTVLRRSHIEYDRSTILEMYGVRLDPARHDVRVNDQPVNLSPKEFTLLEYLMRHSGRVQGRDTILQAVWGDDVYQNDRTVDVHIRWLRMKIEADPANPHLLLTVRGVGYKFAGGP